MLTGWKQIESLAFFKAILRIHTLKFQHWRCKKSDSSEKCFYITARLQSACERRWMGSSGWSKWSNNGLKCIFFGGIRKAWEGRECGERWEGGLEKLIKMDEWSPPSAAAITKAACRDGSSLRSRLNRSFCCWQGDDWPTPSGHMAVYCADGDIDKVIMALIESH